MSLTRPVVRALSGAAVLTLLSSCVDHSPDVLPTGPMISSASGVTATLVGAGDIARCDAQNDEATAALLDNIAGTVATFGDNTLGTSNAPPDFNCYDASWGRHKARTRPSIGHMEGFTSGSATYYQYFGAAAGDSGKGYYSYELGAWHIVVLNSSISMALGSAQEQWLKADLAASSAQCTLAYWHVPRFSSVPNSSGVQILPAVKPLWDDLYAAGAEIVLNGHYEDYERFAPQNPDGGADPARGIRQFVVGTGGIGVNSFNGAPPLPNSEVRNSATFGVIQLALSDSGYAWRFLAVPGQSFTDAGSGTCHGTGASATAASVTVSPSNVSLEVGARYQLTATARDANGQPVDRVITWTSNNTSVAHVSPRGIVTAWAPGTATITATADGQSGTATAAVTATSAVVLTGAGDIATCNALYDEATASLLDEIPGTVFTAGDNAYDSGTAAEYANCYDPTWGRHKARTRPAVGNHDYVTAGAAGYFGYFGAAAGDTAKGYYSYDLGAWHVVVLNNYKPQAAGTVQEQWLRADLAASSKQCTMAVWHEPLFTSGVSHGGAAGVRALFQALYDAGAELVVVGHDHNYERFAPQTPAGVADPAHGVREFVVGTGGAGLGGFSAIAANSEVRNNSAHGVVKLTLRNGSYEWVFIPDPGQTFSDSGSTGCHGPPSGGGTNQPPVAQFTSSCSALTCAFTDGSNDPDGTIAAWNWSFGDGATATTRSPSHTYGAAGTYAVRLIATDNAGAADTATQSVTVTAANQPPAAAFTASCSALACAFTDGSSDPDGSVTVWSWSFGDGATATTQNPSHTYGAAGSYTVRLIATDNAGAMDTSSQTLTVSAANRAPTASFTSSCSALTCSFTDGSSDPDGSITAWSWAFGDGATATTQSPTHTYGTGGTYSVRLIVTDNAGARDTTSSSVTVTAPNQPPAAAFTSSCTALTCSFTDGSADPDGAVIAWSWDFGDGATSTTASPSHAYAAGGTYTVRLTVTDNQGASSSVSHAVTVTQPNRAPVVDAGADQAMLVGLFTIQAHFSDPDGNDGPWSYRIDWGDGLLPVTGSTSDPSQAISATHPYAVPGQFRVRVTVTDRHGNTGSDELILTVTLL